MKLKHAVGAALLLIVGGAVHGMWTHRWSDAATADRVDLLASADPLGGWPAGPATPVDPREVPKGTIVTARSYAHESLRATISVTAGTPGVVAAHTPDVCFLGSGYVLKGPPSRESLVAADGTAVEYHVADFEKTTATGVIAVRCRWAWTADGSWHAPQYPRLTFARSAVLYKVYVVHPLEESEAKDAAYRRFAADAAADLGRRLR